MSTTTPRVALIKPATSDSMSDADAQIGQSWELVDLYAGARALAANPGSSFVGDIIKNTTDGTYRRWSGSRWQWLGHNVFYANSFESSNSQDARQDGFSGGEILVNPANSFQLVINRSYLIHWTMMLEYEADTQGFMRVNLRRSAQNGSVGIGSSLVKEYRFFVDSNGRPTKPASGFFQYGHTDPTGTYQFGLGLAPETAVDFHANGGAGSGGTGKSSSQLIIHEVGF